MSLSTHVLNAVTGRPAADLSVTLERKGDDGWREVTTQRTNADGRIADVLAGAPAGPDGAAAVEFAAGVYRLTFDVAEAFSDLGSETFYPEVTITFTVTDPAEHYHVPLLLSPYAYSTYRGS